MDRRSDLFGVSHQLFILVFTFHLSVIEVFGSLNSEGLALLKFRASVNSDPHNILSTWNTNDDTPCMWTGVFCCGGKVRKLDLSGYALNGTLAPEVGTLSNLQALILYANYFSGAIPREIGKLTKLELLDLRYNNFIGQVPAEIENIISLKHILLCHNNFESDFLGNCILSEALRHETHCMRNRKLGTRFVISLDEDKKTKHRDLQGQFAVLYARNLLDRPRLLAANLQAPFNGGSTSSSYNIPSGQLDAKRGGLSALASSASPQSSPSPPSLLPPTTAPSSTQLPDATTPKSPSKIRKWVFIMIAGAVLILLIGVAFLFSCQRRGEATIKPWKTGLSGQLKTAFVTGAPKLNRPELEAACEDFSNIIGSLPNCTTYKGTLSSGVEIAVTSTTVTSSKDWLRCSEFYFRKKIDMLSRLNHKNFVNLLGYCIEDEPFTRMMVFEYATNGTLSEHLHVKESEHLDWSARMRIIMGVSYCLQYMHHDLSPPIAHPSLNSSSVYLMDDFAAKLADFTYWKSLGEKKLSNDDDELELINQLYTDLENNVFNFGVLLLETISGKVPHSEEHGFIVNWAVDYLNDKHNTSYMIDPSLQSFNNNELDGICEVIRQCILPDPNQRPTMKEVTAKLREVLQISPEAVVPRLSPLWWAELEVLSPEG